MKKISLLTIAFIITLMASTASADSYNPTLYAGQNTPIGWVMIDNDNSKTTLTVRYYLFAPGWSIASTHMHVATSPFGFPMNNNGNPKVGQFTYKTKHNPSVIDFTYVVNLTELDGWPVDTLYIAAHAVVLQVQNDGSIREETAWAACNPEDPDTQFPGSSWATFVEYHVHTHP